jgi:hypothetical protein
LIPLIKFYDELDKTNKNITFMIRDELGPLIRILFSLPIDIKYKYEIKDVVITDLHLQPMDIHPYDQKRDIKMINRGYAQYFTYDVKKQVNNWMISCLRNYDLRLKSKKYDIVIIERKQDKKFKSVVQADNQYKEIFKKSGSERRNISNHDELVTMIKNKFHTCSVLSISLENLGLFDQFHLFRTSKIIIAQHGAALANICFMKKKSLCIEIVSDLILGLQKPNKGKILIDGQNIRNFKHRDYLNLFSLVTQDSYLINDTIEANILIGSFKKTISIKDLEELKRRVRIHSNEIKKENSGRNNKG